MGTDYKCGILSSRAVHLYGFQSYNPNPQSPIMVTIYGIVNPNANNNTLTDYIKIITQPILSKIYDESNS